MGTNQEVTKIRHDWYQTDSHVIVNILCRKIAETDFDVKYEPDSIFVSFTVEETKHNLTFKLLHEINPSQCSYKISPLKVEIKLKKKENYRWAKLENDGSIDRSIKQSMHSVDHPGSSAKQKDWDKVIADMTKNDDDNLKEDAALNALFQKIYSEGSDEVRKAMNKSFIESAGTVLSTNWGDVKKEKVNMRPPDGMEFKKWDS